MRTTEPIFLKILGAEDGSIEGWGTLYGEVDRVGDVLEPGCVSKSLASLKARGYPLSMLWGHDTKQVIGSWPLLREEPEGLYASGRINLGTERGREVHTLVKAGDVSGLSIGFRPVEYELRPNGSFSFSEIDLLELSVVYEPAVAKARIVLKELGGIEDMAAALRAGRPWSRREAEYVARRAWSALSAGDEPDLSPLTQALDRARLDLSQRIKR